MGSSYGLATFRVRECMAFAFLTSEDEKRSRLVYSACKHDMLSETHVITKIASVTCKADGGKHKSRQKPTCLFVEKADPFSHILQPALEHHQQAAMAMRLPDFDPEQAHPHACAINEHKCKCMQALV